MRAILEDTKSGQVQTYEVPPPELRPGGILVRTHFSAISAGTERVKIETGEKSLLQKALARPDLVSQVLQYARTNGVRAAYQKVQARLESLATLGYSSAGTVLEVAEDVQGLRPGDRVACAGGGYANHCEINFIPQNLAVRVPDSVALDAASLTTIGAIAMQGLRQAQVAFGETVAVIGAGLVGALTIQLARAAGCRVIAIDLDPIRAKRAVELGAHLALEAGDSRLTLEILSFSRYGADAAIVTAATPSAEPLELAARILRERGRIVIVGDVGMGVSRSNMYGKELSIAMSRSYGPGRYDPQYEEEGLDYPVGYVRWTEKRNMEAFLDLLAQGSLLVAPLIERRYPVEEGARGYDDIRRNGAYTALIEYGSGRENTRTDGSGTRASGSRETSEALRVGCIGAGSFARSIIFPALQADKHVVLQSVATASGVAAESARRSYRFLQAETPSHLLEDSCVDAVFVLSRHDSHASYVVQAIKSGRPVFVEKPLATDWQQLQAIQEAYQGRLERGELPFVMVGFNRRFAPASELIRQFFAGRREQMLIQVRINAGYQPKGHWTHDHGGRIVGELCHFVDWARSIIAVPIRSVTALALPDGTRYHQDNVTATLTFEDGSLAVLTYLANGNANMPKESYEVFCEGRSAQLNDFRTLTLADSRKAQKHQLHHDKGHCAEVQKTLQAMRSGSPSPIPFEELVEVTETVFAIQKAIAKADPMTVGSRLLHPILAS
jgi:predicted dehydrogenase/threonine dehydrogenase-like Zn-dependent dehydrogenase